LLFDRFWIDHEPKDQKDEFQALFVSGDHPVGHFAAQTIWAGRWEGFHYHVVPRQDGVIDVMLPSRGANGRGRYTARQCSEGGFDYCLDLSGSPRGVRRYFSRKSWQVKEAELDAAGERVRSLLDRRP